MSPIILDPDYNPYLSSSGMDSEGLDVNEALSSDAYTTPCGRPDLIAPQLHTFPRSLSSSSNGSTTSAGSLDSVDSYPGGPSEENPMWVHHYDIHGQLAYSMDQHPPQLDNYNVHEYSNVSPLETIQVLSAPLLSSASYSHDHEAQHPQSLQFHHHMPIQANSSTGLVPSNNPQTPPLSAPTSFGGPTKGVIQPLIHHHQFPAHARPSQFKRAFHFESGPLIMPHSPPSAKRRKSVSAPTPNGNPALGNPKSPKQSTPLTDDDNLLLKLKDEENLPWKLIQKRFVDMDRGDFKVPTLQMRYKRLKEKMRVWEADDVGYLKEAKEAVTKEFWEMVSRKMVELGCKKKIPGVACERKWRELDTVDNRDYTKPASPKLGQGEEGMSPPPETRSPSRRGSFSGPGMLPPAPSQMPLPSAMVQQLAAAQLQSSLREEITPIQRELGTLAEGDEM